MRWVPAAAAGAALATVQYLGGGDGEVGYPLGAGVLIGWVVASLLAGFLAPGAGIVVVGVVCAGSFVVGIAESPVSFGNELWQVNVVATGAISVLLIATGAALRRRSDA